MEIKQILKSIFHGSRKRENKQDKAKTNNAIDQTRQLLFMNPLQHIELIVHNFLSVFI
jgi:hypothetical protein